VRSVDSKFSTLEEEMRHFYLPAVLIVGTFALAGCNSTTTAADYARMDAYAQMNAPGARGAPTPKEMAAMGYFRTDEQLAGEGHDIKTARDGSGSQFANLRFVGR
jgi:hypothetical protein